tara:strand:- start:1866 stop:2144 length:279 start_codon:yes stop_codon:yes gene_type:complete
MTTNKGENIMYYIYVKNYYYQGTFNSPKNAALEDYYGEKKLFMTEIEAKNYLLSIGASHRVKGKTYTHEGIYHLNDGEYASPDYSIRKVRSK